MEQMVKCGNECVVYSEFGEKRKKKKNHQKKMENILKFERAKGLWYRTSKIVCRMYNVRNMTNQTTT